MIDLEMLLRVPHVDSYNGFALSPDGERVAFAWNVSGQWELYELRLDGTSAPHPLTRSIGGKFGPKYSPDGCRLAYVVDSDGSENFHLFVYDFSSQQHTDLTPGISYALQPNLAWSPDGKEIAFLADLSGCFCAYVVSADGGQSRLVLDVGHPVWQVAWSPNGQWLAVTAETQGQDYGVFVVPSGGGAVRQITEAGSLLNVHHACWSPDSQYLAFSSDLSGMYEIGVWEVCSGKVEWLTAGGGDKEHVAWSPDGAQLAYILSRGANTWLAVQRIGETAATYQVEAGVHASPEFLPSGSRLAFIFDNPRCPQDLWLLDIPQQEMCQLTHSLPPALAEVGFVMPEEIYYPGVDGKSVPAVLYRPMPLREPRAAVVNIHGGPNWLYQLAWNPVMFHMASRGWVVLGPNYRGSTGYGRAWQVANRFDLGGGDTDDVAAGAKYLVREGLAVPGQIVVTGRSHGGYLTMTCLTRYPELWAAGSAVVPFLNWFTSHANAREDLQHWDKENFGDPVVNFDLWHERSPFFFLDRVCAPVQFICGGHDPRCPASESIEARDLLLRLGKEVDFALYADEGHSFLKLENIVDADVRRVSFLARMLEKE